MTTAQATPVPHWRHRFEDALGTVVLALMVGLPVADLGLRWAFQTSVPGGTSFAQNLTLWAGFLGAAIAARDGGHLRLTTGDAFQRWISPRFLDLMVATISVAVCVGLARASYGFLISEMATPVRLGGWLPPWVFIAVLPASFAVIALRFALALPLARDKATALSGGLIALAFALIPAATTEVLLWPAFALVLLAAVVGLPIFIALGAAALLLFTAADVPVAAIMVEAYRISVSPAIPMIPLFVLAGFLLAAGRAGDRLMALFQSYFGWIPGGLAIVVILSCAFFSTFTGASGVTILALGGLMLPMLVKGGYTRRFSLGLVTSSGSIGLLFPPSLAVILYAVVAHVPIPDMFKAGLGPGLALVGLVCAFAVIMGLRSKASRPPFRWRTALAATWRAKWEIGMPIVAIGGIFGGLMTLMEAAAVTAFYAFVTQALIHRDIHPIRDLPGIFLKSITLLGGVFAILGVSMGLTNYLVDAQIPTQAAAWVEANVDSRVVFLLALNVFLLAVGCLMDIYSATVVVVPLILPMGAVFGIHPLHLGMIFLVNLELGYLTPPVGMYLFLSAFRFERPFGEVCRAVLPFLGVLLVVVLVVTYVPELSLFFAGGGN
ncbi:MAG: TRAP transporter large permease subunit [Alphaproteobacteria bacterium]